MGTGPALHNNPMVLSDVSAEANTPDTELQFTALAHYTSGPYAGRTFCNYYYYGNGSGLPLQTPQGYIYSPSTTANCLARGYRRWVTNSKYPLGAVWAR